MQKRFGLTKIVLPLSILFISLLMSGCSSNKGQQQDAQLQAAQEKTSEEKESEKLKKLEAQIEDLFKALGGPSLKADESDKDKSESQPETTQQKSTQQQGTQQGGQQEGTQQQGTQQGGKQASQEPDKWTQVGRIINNLHYQWNDFMPEISKKGADMKLIDNFDNALNSLTTTIDSKDQGKALTAANKLYSLVPDLYSLYRTKMSPEVKRIIYYTRNIILESDKSNWEQVKNDNEALEKSWPLIRNTLEKEQKAIGDKLDFSIYELKKVITEKNKQLTGIKGRIVLNNIMLLQKEY